MTTGANLREIFEEAVGLAPEDRRVFLESRCADPEMRQRIERMLAADTENDVVFEQSADAVARVIGDPDVRQMLPPGSRIGPFELIEVLGEGGSSTVFRAVRDADGVRQHVALKLLRRGLYSPEARRQFRRERHALAQLQHPGIARLIEGGVSDSGLAYIALDLVEGEPITDHARARRMDLRVRLELFLQVCRAVEAAHHALIVHRDLKPSNVLVTAAGEVKLLDFGIAKLLDADDDDTQTRLPAFTPAYAAPEQRSGGLITTATDVYALGVVLGELVTGRRLNDGSSRTPSDRVAAATEPGVLPASPEITRRQLRGDIDNIVLKAIASEPERRYASAGALAADIERLLDGRPVSAHPPSTWYRTRKFVARHKSGVGASVAVVVAVLAALTVALWQANAARREALRANAMRDFMFSAFAEAEPGSPREGPPTIAAVVEQSAHKARADAAMNIDARTELLTQLGGVLRGQGRLDSARENLEWNYAQAKAAFGETAALTLAAGRELLATMILRGDFAEARTLADRLIAIAPPRGAGVRSLIFGDSALLASKEHEYKRASADSRTSVELAEASGDPDLVDQALEGAGNVALGTNQPAEAVRTYEELLTRYTRKHGARHLSVAGTQASLSRAYRQQGDLVRAEEHIHRALEIDDAVLAHDDWRRAEHLNALTMVMYQQRDYKGALDAAAETLRINRVARGEDHPEIANDYNSVGMMHALLEEWSDAVTPLREALRRSEAAYGPEHFETAVTRSNLGVVLANSGDVAAGEAELAHAIASLEKAEEPEPDEVAATYEKLARIRLDRGDADGALTAIGHIESALAKETTVPAYWNGRVAMLRATALLRVHKPREARALLETAAADLARSAKPDVVLRVEVPLLTAEAAASLGDSDAHQLRDSAAAALDKLRYPPRRLSDIMRQLKATPDSTAAVP